MRFVSETSFSVPGALFYADSEYLGPVRSSRRSFLENGTIGFSEIAWEVNFEATYLRNRLS